MLRVPAPFLGSLGCAAARALCVGALCVGAVCVGCGPTPAASATAPGASPPAPDRQPSTTQDAPKRKRPGKRPSESSPGDSGAELAKQYDGKPALTTLSGEASYYADSLAGNSTASGTPYRPHLHSAAHRKLPFGTVVRVIRKDTGATTYAVINDRGPFGGRGRIIDLSRAAATDLDMIRAGVVKVRVEVVKRP